MTPQPLDVLAPQGWEDDPRPLVVALTHCAEPSGAELFLLRVTARMRRHRVLVVLGAHGPLEQLLAERGVAVAVLPLDPVARAQRADDTLSPLHAVRQGVRLLRTARTLARHLRQLRPAVVWTHSAKAHLYGGVAGRLARVPVVTHVHDLVRRPGASAVGVATMLLALRGLPRGIIANSRTTLASIGGAARGHVTVIGCPVVLSGAGAGADGPGAAGAPLVVGVLGRLAGWKGQHVVIRAFAIARARGDLPARSHLRVMGAAMFEDDHSYAASLVQLVESLGVADVVEFTGHVGDPDAALRSCDVIVHASVRSEPFGQVVVEAMACGCAVIASAEGGPSEVITSGVDGLLVAPEDPDVLADAMTALAIDPARRSSLGAAARRSAERFAPEIIVAEIEGFLTTCAVR